MLSARSANRSHVTRREYLSSRGNYKLASSS